MYGYFIVTAAEFDVEEFDQKPNSLPVATEYDNEWHIIDAMSSAEVAAEAARDLAGEGTTLVAAFLTLERAQQYQAMLTE